MKVLILAQRLPYAPNRGDRVRVYHMMREVAAHAQVDVGALVHDEEEASHAGDLSDLAGEVITAPVPRLRNLVRGAWSLPGSVPLTHVLLDSPALVPALRKLVRRRRPDVILAFCSSMARFAFDESLKGIPVVIDMIDADSAKWAALARVTSPPLRWVYQREAKLLGRFEAVAMRRSFATLVVNEKERAALKAVDPESHVRVLENGVDVRSFAPAGEPVESNDVVFCGAMNYGPNAEAARYLARDVWPLVRDVLPQSRLWLVGSSPTSEVLALNSPDTHVNVTGTVADVRKYLWSAAVAAAPLRIARGVQNKVLEAIAAGLPCVVTPEVADGLPKEIAPACVVGHDAKGFASALIDVLKCSPRERRERASRVDLTPLLWSARLEALLPLLEEAIGKSAGSADERRMSVATGSFV